MNPQILLITTAITTVIIGSVVWARQPRHIINQSFLSLCLSLSIWMITNAMFTVIENTGLQYLDALVSYAAAACIATFFLAFALALVGRSRYNTLLIASGAVVALLSAVPNILAVGVSKSSIITTPFIKVYALILLAYFITGIAALIIRRHKLAGRRRSQVDAVLFGAFGACVGGVICNLALPLASDHRYVAIGPVFSLLFIVSFSYSMIRHRLFDVRRAIVRVFAYTLIVVVLGAGFGYVAARLIETFPNTANQTPVLIATAIGIAVCFAPTKKFFDALTQKLFFADEYNAQTMISKMTTVFANAANEKNLVRQTSSLLAEIIGARSVSLVGEIDETVKHYISHGQTPLLIRDHIEETHYTTHLINILEKNNVAVIAALNVEDMTIGYLQFGEKVNGTAYSPHDIEFINVIANAFAIALQNVRHLENIKQFNDELQSKIHEATTELRQTNHKLRELDETKDEFISMTSHQLRTPLTSIKGYISMLLEGDLGKLSVEQRKALEQAFDSSQRMVYLIGDFLNLSRLQTGRFELELSKVSLSSIIKDEIAQLQASAISRNVKLLYHPPENFPLLEVDENKLRQVMMNFVDNAIYYSKQNGGEVTITLRQDSDRIIFEVKDNGIGVPKDERHNLFTKFYRSSNAQKIRPDGTGIGLFMAKKVIAAHDGEIIFESEENKGSTFGFSLPLEKM